VIDPALWVRAAVATAAMSAATGVTTKPQVNSKVTRTGTEPLFKVKSFS
jgi:hypothetical protein